jgi:hypothetical protein
LNLQIFNQSIHQLTINFNQRTTGDAAQTSGKDENPLKLIQGGAKDLESGPQMVQHSEEAT